MDWVSSRDISVGWDAYGALVILAREQPEIVQVLVVGVVGGAEAYCAGLRA